MGSIVERRIDERKRFPDYARSLRDGRDYFLPIRRPSRFGDGARAGGWGLRRLGSFTSVYRGGGGMSPSMGEGHRDDMILMSKIS